MADIIEKVVQDLGATNYELVGKYDLVRLYEEGEDAPFIRIVSVPTQDGFLRNTVCFSFWEDGILRLGTLDRNCLVYLEKDAQLCDLSHTETVQIYNLDTTNGPDIFFIITLSEEAYQLDPSDYIRWTVNV